jgi:hypothetical protein
MVAVWSFWTKPFKCHHATAWASEKHHLLSWVLSVESARRHYSRTSLYTDDEGAALLITGIGLEFDHVSTDLNRLHKHDSEWWMLGKLYTYRAQMLPFVHLDADVFLWRSLPERLHAAPVFAQHPEQFSFEDQRWYRTQLYEAAVRSAGGWLPEEWYWYTSQKGNEAVCCGFLGTTRVEFVNYYADQAIRTIEHPTNQAAWSQFNKIQDNILLEQYFLAACLRYHKNHSGSGFDGIWVEHLFDSMAAAYESQDALHLGYTHLIADAKANPILAHRLEARVRRDYPAHYRRIIQYLADQP